MPVDAVDQPAEGADLVDHLILGAEDMAIILRELAHPQDTVQRAMRLVAVAAAHFAQPDRQIAIAGDALLEDQHMGRAVHRL